MKLTPTSALGAHIHIHIHIHTHLLRIEDLVNVERGVRSEAEAAGARADHARHEGAVPDLIIRVLLVRPVCALLDGELRQAMPQPRVEDGHVHALARVPEPPQRLRVQPRCHLRGRNGAVVSTCMLGEEEHMPYARAALTSPAACAPKARRLPGWSPSSWRWKEDAAR